MTGFFNRIIPNVMDKLPDFFEAIRDTLIMVGWSGIIAFVLGLFLGIVITVTKPGGILENKVLYQILDKLINFFPVDSLYHPVNLGDPDFKSHHGNRNQCGGCDCSVDHGNRTVLFQTGGKCTGRNRSWINRSSPFHGIRTA